MDNDLHTDALPNSESESEDTGANGSPAGAVGAPLTSAPMDYAQMMQMLMRMVEQDRLMSQTRNQSALRLQPSPVPADEGAGLTPRGRTPPPPQLVRCSSPPMSTAEDGEIMDAADESGLSRVRKFTDALRAAHFYLYNDPLEPQDNLLGLCRDSTMLDISMKKTGTPGGLRLLKPFAEVYTSCVSSPTDCRSSVLRVASALQDPAVLALERMPEVESAVAALVLPAAEAGRTPPRCVNKHDRTVDEGYIRLYASHVRMMRVVHSSMTLMLAQMEALRGVAKQFPQLAVCADGDEVPIWEDALAMGEAAYAATALTAAEGGKITHQLIQQRRQLWLLQGHMPEQYRQQLKDLPVRVQDSPGLFGPTLQATLDGLQANLESLQTRRKLGMTGQDQILRTRTHPYKRPEYQAWRGDKPRPPAKGRPRTFRRTNERGGTTAPSVQPATGGHAGQAARRSGSGSGGSRARVTSRTQSGPRQ